MRARILAVVLLAAFAAPAHAAYPEKPIRFVVPSASGGSVDVLMRILTQQLSAQMGVAFVVENKPGGSYVPGTMDIVKAAPDGYTLGYGNIVSLAVNRTLLPTLPYDVEKDLTLVSNCVQVFNMLAVNNALPVRTVAELIDYAKKHPGKLSNGSSGNGTTGHLGGELFKSMTGTESLSREVILRLHAEIRKALAHSAVAERYRQLDAEPDGGGPEAFLELVRRETPKWAEVIRRSGAKVD